VRARVGELARAEDEPGHAVDVRGGAKGAHHRAELGSVEGAAVVGVEAVEDVANDSGVERADGHRRERGENLREIERAGGVRVEARERRVGARVELRVRGLEAEALAQDVAQGVAEEARQRGRHRKARDNRDGGATRARRGRAPRG
jgi:hypothetical protein